MGEEGGGGVGEDAALADFGVEAGVDGRVVVVQVREEAAAKAALRHADVDRLVRYPDGVDAEAFSGIFRISAASNGRGSWRRAYCRPKYDGFMGQNLEAKARRREGAKGVFCWFRLVGGWDGKLDAKTRRRNGAKVFEVLLVVGLVR